MGDQSLEEKAKTVHCSEVGSNNRRKHVRRAHFMPGPVRSFIYDLAESSKQSKEVRIIIIPILQIGMVN